jgi:hypothetical protein
MSLIAQRFQLSGYHHSKKAIRKICLSMAGWLRRGKLSFSFNKTPAMTKLLLSSAASKTDNAPDRSLLMYKMLKSWLHTYRTLQISLCVTMQCRFISWGCSGGIQLSIFELNISASCV